MSEPEIISLEDLEQEELATQTELSDLRSREGLDTWTGESHDS